MNLRDPCALCVSVVINSFLLLRRRFKSWAGCADRLDRKGRSWEEVAAVSLIFNSSEPIRPLVGGISPYSRPNDQQRESGGGRNRRKRPETTPENPSPSLDHPHGGEDIDRYV